MPASNSSPSTHEADSGTGTELAALFRRALATRGAGEDSAGPAGAGDTEMKVPVDTRASSSPGSAADPSDAWVPQAGTDGQIYYLNETTGQRARDLPPLSAVGGSGGPILASRPAPEEGAGKPDPGPAPAGANVPPGPGPPQAHSPTEIVFDNDGAVRAGTVPALVAHLTAHEHCDPAFERTFMASFRVFTSADELLDLLVRRFWMQPTPPPGLAPAEHEAWVACTGTQQAVQRSVLNAFGRIIQLDESPTVRLCILERVKDFIAAAHVAGPEAHHLQSVIEHAEHAVDLPSEDSEAPCEAVADKLQLREIEPLELARQLTIMESGLFRRIRLTDCLRRATEHSAEDSDNFTTFVSTNIKIPLWVSLSILNEDKSQRRAKVVKYWIVVADRCRALNNFSTMAAIQAALSAPSISGLKRTWTHVSQRYVDMLAACATIMDSGKGFWNYRRAALAAAVPPGVPFMGILLTTLQFIHEGTPDYLRYIPGQNGDPVPVLGTPLVNFNKWRKVCEFMDDSVKPWQKPFNLRVLAPIQAYIEDALGAINPSQELDESLGNLSLLREPRDRLGTSGDEKTSGFL